MPKKNDAWGIEVGANAIKAVRLIRGAGQVEVAGYEILPFKHILTTPDMNVDEAVQVGLDTFLQKHEDAVKSTIVVSVPGHMAFARFAKLPPVEPKKIPDIVRFEAVQQIPFPIEQVEWDYQVFQQSDSPDVEVGIFAISKDRVMTFLNNYRSVNLRVDALTLSPVAVYNAFAWEHEEDGKAEGTIFMDIGSTATDLIIVEGGQIWLRTLPIGGNNFTEALMRAFKLSYHKAEKLKKEAGTSKYARQIFQAMRPVFADLVQEMQRSLGYYQSRTRDSELNRLVGVGSTFRLPGLQKFLKQQLQLDVVRPSGFKRALIEGKMESDFAENALNMATAFGCALQGLGLDDVSANLLPDYTMKQRMWKAKEPWIAGAAACLVVASGLAGFSQFSAKSAFESGKEETDRMTKRVKADAGRAKAEWSQLSNRDNPLQKIENLRRTIDYRDLWPNILDDVATAMESLKPQEETIGPDYSEHAKIERNERRRVFIESLETTYVPRPGEGTPVKTEPQFGPNGMPMFDDGGGSSAASQPGLEGPFRVEDFFQGPNSSTLPPTIRLRIVGTTPIENAPVFIDNRFVTALFEAAKRNGKPYVPTKPRLESLEAVGGEANTPGGTNKKPQTHGGGGGPFGGPFAQPGAYGGNKPANQQLNSATADELVPGFPLANEARQNDQRFVIIWELRLVSPEEQRQAKPNPAPPPTTDGEPPAEPDTQPEASVAPAPEAETAKIEETQL